MKTPIKELADDLLGTCETFNSSEYTTEELKVLDDTIRCCDDCGWWVETHECTIGADTRCEDCLED